MKNPKIIALILSVLVLMIVGAFLLVRRNSLSVQVNTPAGPGTVEVTTGQGQISILDLLKEGKDVKCTYQASGMDFGSVNTVLYTASGKSRIEAVITDNDGQTRRSFTVSDGKYIYTWSDTEAAGVKMPIEPSASSGESDNWQGQVKYVDPNQKLDYQCEAWTVDDSMFTPPANITFTDLGQVSNSQCAVCNSLTGEQRETCRKSFNCN